MKPIFFNRPLPKEYDYIAPDGSEIRLLAGTANGGLCHCILPPGCVSKAVKHKTVDEIWYCLSGKGTIWQQNENGEDLKEFTTGDSFTIPSGNSFQFRNNETGPLQLIIATIPKWPGPDEAVGVNGKWIDE